MLAIASCEGRGVCIELLLGGRIAQILGLRDVQRLFLSTSAAVSRSVITASGAAEGRVGPTENVRAECLNCLALTVPPDGSR